MMPLSYTLRFWQIPAMRYQLLLDLRAACATIVRPRATEIHDSRENCEAKPLESKFAAALAILAGLLLATPASAQIAVSANDGKHVLVDGVQSVPDSLGADSVTVIGFAHGAPRITATIAAPASVIGPPRSVAVAPDESFALVTSARRISSSDPHQIVPDDRVTVIDLRSMRVTQTLTAGPGASGIAINPAGTLALVANRAAGTLSVFAIAGDRLTLLTTIPVGDPASSPAQPLFYANGTRALVSRDGDHRIALLAIEGQSVRLLPDTIAPGLRPYGIDAAGPRSFAVSANIGGGGRDVDTVSLIDLTPTVPRVIDTVAVGLTPEGIKMSADGRFVALAVNNGSNLAPSAATYHPQGQLQIWEIADRHLKFVTQADAGGWGQGIVWSRDGHTLLIQSMRDRVIEAFHFDGRRLKRTAVLPMPAGPAAIATAEP